MYYKVPVRVNGDDSFSLNSEWITTFPNLKEFETFEYIDYEDTTLTQRALEIWNYAGDNYNLDYLSPLEIKACMPYNGSYYKYIAENSSKDKKEVIIFWSLNDKYYVEEINDYYE